MLAETICQHLADQVFLSLNSYVMYNESHFSSMLQKFPFPNMLVGEKAKKHLI